MEFISDKHAFLLDNGSVDLGELPASGGLRWAEMEDFVFRVLLYSALREQLRGKIIGRKHVTKRQSK